MDFEQEEHDASAVPAKGLSTPLIPNVENFFLTSLEPHSGQATTVEAITSNSKSTPHAVHLYSNIGIPDYNKP